MNRIIDAIIIGGGVHGASLAFHLAHKGLKAAVLERRFLASEATGYSSGVVRMHYDLEPESRLAWTSFQYFRNWAEMVGGECGFTRTGFINIVPHRLEPQLKANVAMHQQVGIPALLVSAADVHRLAPQISVEDFEWAAYEPESGYADPSGTTRSLMDAARQRGAQLVQDCLVTGIKVHGGKVGGVTSTQGDFDAPVVVNAAGPWAARVAQMAGVNIPVDTWRHETLFIRRPKKLGITHPTMIDLANEMYFRPETGGLTLVGLEDGNPLGESPEGNTGLARPGFVDRAVDRICRRMPGMDLGSLHSTQAGYDGITPDQRAILGAAGPDGFYLQCGFSGTGFKLAPAVGACMAELILDGEAKTVDISPFDPERFAQGKLLTGEYGSTWH